MTARSGMTGRERMADKEQLPAHKVPARNVPSGRKFGAGAALPTLQRVLGNRAVGRLLDSSSHHDMERHFGVDLSHVRVHDDAQAGVQAHTERPPSPTVPTSTSRVRRTTITGSRHTEPHGRRRAADYRAEHRQARRRQRAGPLTGALLPGARRAGELLDLQRLVGNRVVGGFLASGRPSLASSRFGGFGQPLPPLVRLEMERQFGVDFAAVRVHTGLGAQRFLHQSNAEAATLGDSIAMASMPTFPISRAGRRLLAHELAHVVQQRRGGRQPSPLPGSSLEVGADRAAAAVDTASFGIRVDGASGVGIARQLVASAQRRDPAAMSTEELQQEIQLLEKWLLDQSTSSIERAEAEMQLAELRQSLAARQPGPQPSGSQGSAAAGAPQRSLINIWADQALSWHVHQTDQVLSWCIRQTDDAQAQFSQSIRNLASGLPPAQFTLVDTAVGVIDAIFDTLQSIMMFWIGAQAGSLEVIFETAVGFVKLVLFAVELLGGLLADLIALLLRRAGVNIQLQGPSGLEFAEEAGEEAVAALKRLPKAILDSFTAWQARYRAAPPELKAAMLGRLLPEIVTLLLAGVGVARTGKLAVQALARTSTVRAVVIGGAIATREVVGETFQPASIVMSEGRAAGYAETARNVVAPSSTVPAVPTVPAIPAAVAPPVAAPVAAPAASVAAVGSTGKSLATAGALTSPELMSLAYAASLAPASASGTTVPTTAQQGATQSVQPNAMTQDRNVLAETLRTQHAPFSDPNMWGKLRTLLKAMRSASGIRRETKSVMTPDVDRSLGGNMAVSLTNIEGVPNGGVVVGRSPEAGGKAVLGSPFSPHTDPVKTPHTHRHAEQEWAERFYAAFGGLNPAAWQGCTVWLLVEAAPCAPCMNDVLPALSAAFPGLTVEVKNLEGSRILRYRDGVLLNP
jgi:hypothetical protein